MSCIAFFYFRYLAQQPSKKRSVLANFAGVKFTDTNVMAFNLAGNAANRKFNMLFGRDEEMLSAMVTGVMDVDIGSTVNFMSFNLQARQDWEDHVKHVRDPKHPAANSSAHGGEMNPALTRAQTAQLKTAQVIQVWQAACASPAINGGDGAYGNPQKAILKLTGIDFGPMRPPQRNPNLKCEKALAKGLKAVGVNVTQGYWDEAREATETVYQ